MAAKADYQAAQRAVNEDIKNRSFRPVYLLVGEQAYLRKQNRDRLCTAVLGSGEDSIAGLSDNFNFSRFRDEDADVDRIIEMAETLPFFADHRVILLEDTPLFDKGAAEAQRLAEYLPGMPSGTVMILSQSKADKRSKLYKAIEKQGFVLDCDTVDEVLIGKWTAGLFAKAGLAISGADLAWFLDRTGTDMLGIRSETEKIISYKMENGVPVRGTVTRADMEAVSSARLKDRIFDLTDAIARKQADTVFAIYMELCELQTAPQILLSLLQRQFLTILKVGELSAKMSDADIARELKLPPFVITKRYKPVLKSYRRSDLIALVDRCAAIDMEYRSGKIDAGAALEMLMAGASRKVE